jgi:hypothetical protein
MLETERLFLMPLTAGQLRLWVDVADKWLHFAIIGVNENRL